MRQTTENTNFDLNEGLKTANLHSATPLNTDLSMGGSVGLLGTSASSAAVAATPTKKAWLITTDFNGDRQTDVIWRDNQTGNLQIWLMNGTNISSTFNVSGMSQQWDFRIGDFNGDGKSDLFWRNYTTGENQVWLNSGNGSSFSKTNLFLVDPKVEGNWYFDIGDFNGDGKHDLMWRNYDDGRNSIWMMDGENVTAGFIYQLDGTHLPYDFEIGDFNGDGKTDLFWRHAKTGENAVWLMNGLTFTQAESTFTVDDFNWDYEIGDTNNDGKSDIIWNNRKTGDVALWQFNGTVADAKFIYRGLALSWEFEIADVNGDGNTDFVWRNYQDNQVAVWEINGFNFNSYFLNVSPPVGRTEEFSITDVNGDGKADLFWRNYLSGDNRLWLLNGAQVSSTALANLPKGWLSN